MAGVLRDAEQERGAERRRLEALEWVRETFEDEHTCPICLDPLPFGESGHTTVTLSCHRTHQFCHECIQDALTRDDRAVRRAARR
jgi:hypothetical protein